MHAAPTLDEVWSQYGQRLRGYLAARASNPADVDDVLQVVLLRTHDKLASVRDLGQLRGWLFRVARNALIDHERQVSRRRETADVSESVAAEAVPEPPEADQVELSSCVRVFVERLDPKDRDVLEAVDLQGRTQRAIADDLGVSYSTVKSRVQRARDRLAADLSGCCAVEIGPDGRVLGTPHKRNPCN